MIVENLLKNEKFLPKIVSENMALLDTFGNYGERTLRSQYVAENPSLPRM